MMCENEKSRFKSGVPTQVGVGQGGYPLSSKLLRFWQAKKTSYLMERANILTHQYDHLFKEFLENRNTG